MYAYSRGGAGSSTAAAAAAVSATEGKKEGGDDSTDGGNGTVASVPSPIVPLSFTVEALVRWRGSDAALEAQVTANTRAREARKEKQRDELRRRSGGSGRKGPTTRFAPKCQAGGEGKGGGKKAPHPMVISGFAQGPYAGGWVCDKCRGHGAGERWFCQSCGSDLYVDKVIYYTYK